jgi:uncharacterized protein YbjT (DUF2867 family)
VDVAIAGGHGKIALLLARLLSDAGHGVRGLIRDPGQAADLAAAGADAVICDLEGDDDVAAAITGTDAVVFAAGAGPGSGADRKRTMDRDGAVKLIEAAQQAGVSRYLMISAMGARAGAARGDDVFGVYLQMKAEADAALQASGLEFTIVRPGRLTDEPGTGRVTAGERAERGSIPRADVAAALFEALGAPNTIGRTFELVSGETPVADAVRAL